VLPPAANFRRLILAFHAMIQFDCASSDPLCHSVAAFAACTNLLLAAQDCRVRCRACLALHRSAELYSAVSQSCTLPGDRTGRRVDRSDAPPNTIRRYSRLKICATAERPQRAKQRPDHPSGLHRRLAAVFTECESLSVEELESRVLGVWKLCAVQNVSQERGCGRRPSRRTQAACHGSAHAQRLPLASRCPDSESGVPRTQPRSFRPFDRRPGSYVVGPAERVRSNVRARTSC